MINKLKDIEYYKSGMKIGKNHTDTINKAAVESATSEFNQIEKIRKAYKKEQKDLKIKVGF